MRKDGRYQAAASGRREHEPEPDWEGQWQRGWPLRGGSATRGEALVASHQGLSAHRLRSAWVPSSTRSSARA